MKNHVWLSTFSLVALTNCGDILKRSLSTTTIDNLNQVALLEANLEECPMGGTAVVVYKDLNQNGSLDDGETVQARSPMCRAVAGDQGQGVGVVVASAPPEVCTAGGVMMSTFVDFNNNQLQEESEQTTSSTPLCNGINGSNGENGLSTHYTMGAVGTPTATVGISACHHDFLFFANDDNSAPGWLLFRHQHNGNSDQGIGSTGFQVWNVDIQNFSLASEVGGVTYCQLTWDAQERVLHYTVVSNGDGLMGEEGSIEL